MVDPDKQASKVKAWRAAGFLFFRLYIILSLAVIMGPTASSADGFVIIILGAVALIWSIVEAARMW